MNVGFFFLTFFLFLHLLQQEGEIQSVKRGLHALFFPWRTFQFDQSHVKVPQLMRGRFTTTGHTKSFI